MYVITLQEFAKAMGGPQIIAQFPDETVEIRRFGEVEVENRIRTLRRDRNRQVSTTGLRTVSVSRLTSTEPMSVISLAGR
jgi:hypothetical protein